MNISKTLFKNLTRCNNFASLYDMYLNRFLHEVKEIDGQFIEKEIIEDINNLEEDLFSEAQDEISDIFSEMFDEETGEDLTEVTNAQMEAFKDIFTEVERLASKQIEKMLGKNIIASTDTYMQKRYAYSIENNTFYCYLDIYYEDDDSIKVFEVKSTTSTKYDEFVITVSKEKFPFFIKTKEGIMKYVGDDWIGSIAGEKEITKEDVDKKKKNLFNRFSKEGKYIYDIAVERNIIENSIKQAVDVKEKKIDYYLVTLNAEYHFDGKYDENNQPIYGLDKDGNELFKIYDVNQITEEYQPIIEIEKEELLKRLDYLTINTKSLGVCCEYKKTTQCKFCNICMKKILQPGSIMEYLGRHYAFNEVENGDKVKLTVYDLVNRGIYMIDEAVDYISKPNNVIQYECYVNNETYMDEERIKYALKEIKYPIYHLDFESYNCPLPRFYMEKPYQQSLFQYSLHIEKKPGICDLEKDHYEFLAKDHHDHRLELVEQLIKDIDLSNGGCVMVYNKAFEQTRLKELSEIYPQYKKELLNINEHIYDLKDVIQGNKKLFEKILPINIKEKLDYLPGFTFYDNKLHGSFSIKKVLPIFTNLSYANLVVKNGTEAIVTYGALPTLTDKEYEEKYLALRVYCRQDTWAMVEILRGLRNAIQKEKVH